MSVPEAAVNKHHRFVTPEHNVGFSRKVFGVEPKAETGTMQEASDDNLGFRIFSPNARHHAATGSAVYNIGHQQSKTVSSFARTRWLPSRQDNNDYITAGQDCPSCLASLVSRDVQGNETVHADSFCRNEVLNCLHSIIDTPR